MIEHLFLSSVAPSLWKLELMFYTQIIWKQHGYKQQVWNGHLEGILSISQKTFSYLYQGLIPAHSLCFISSSISVLRLETLGWIEIVSLGSLPCSPLPACLWGGKALSHAATSRPWLNPKSGRSDKVAPALRPQGSDCCCGSGCTIWQVYARLHHLLHDTLKRDAGKLCHWFRI